MHKKIKKYLHSLKKQKIFLDNEKESLLIKQEIHPSQVASWMYDQEKMNNDIAFYTMSLRYKELVESGRKEDAEILRNSILESHNIDLNNFI